MSADRTDAVLPDLRRARARALEAGSRFVALRRAVPAKDPLEAFASSREANRIFWCHPNAKLSLCGLGEAAVFETSGPARFTDTAQEVRRWLDEMPCVGVPGPDPSGPIALTGFGFDPCVGSDPLFAAFPPARAVLPRETRVRVDGQGFELRLMAVDESTSDGSEFAETAAAWLGHAAEGEPAVNPAPQLQGEDDGAGPSYRVQADRSHAAYEGQVAQALAEIEAGRLDKVVLARALDVEHEGRFDLPGFLDRLRILHPACATFAFVRGAAAFVAASPERLVALAGDRVRATALAGSAARGRNPEEDQRLAEALRLSDKDRREHAAVVTGIRDSLRDVCGELDGSDEPGLLRLAGIQHLETALCGRLQGPAPAGVLDLVSRLHPTPAVAGTPTTRALDWIDRHEALERGWYAGPVGWIAPAGQGEFWVSLRCGVFENPAPEPHAVRSRSCARLFAGAGLVAGSQPRAELAETRIKLRALLAPLTEI